MRIPSGVTDQYIYFVAVDSTDFTTRETGLSSFTVYRSRNGAAAAAMTTPTINETDATNMPGVYELLLDEDMTIGSGNDSEEMVFHITATGMAPVTRTIELYRPKITIGSTLDSAQLVDDIWDEQLTGGAHNVTNSAGRRLRALGDFGNYVGGYVWVDTVNGAAGTTDFENGTINNPVSTIADAITLAASVGLRGFAFYPGSSITLAASVDNYIFTGSGYSVALGGQSLSGCLFENGSISGNDSGSNANKTVYHNCTIGTSTLGLHTLKQCGLSGNITLAEAGTYDWNFCSSQVAGTGTPSVDVGTAVGNTNLNVRHYSGGLEVQQMGDTGTDNMSLEGNGQLVVNANCSGGTITVRGNFRITDNSSGAVSIVPTVPTIDQVHQGEAQAGSANTITLSASASATDGFYDPGEVILFSGGGAGQSRSIIDYNGTTKVAVVDKDWRTNPDSTSQYVIRSKSSEMHVNEGQAQAGASTTITLNTAASSTDDIYIGQTVFLVGGTGQDQARIVIDYNGTTKVATVHKAWNTNPDSTTSYIMVPLPTVGDVIVNTETDTQDIQSRLPAALVSGRMDSNMSAIADNATAATNLGDSALGIVRGECEATPTTTVIQTNLAETTDDHYIGRVVVFITGNAAGEATDITDYTGSTGTLTVTALTTAPAATDKFVIV
jgi:hypothetical protein